MKTPNESATPIIRIIGIALNLFGRGVFRFPINQSKRLINPAGKAIKRLAKYPHAMPVTANQRAKTRERKKRMSE